MITIFDKNKQRVPIKIWRKQIYEVEADCIQQALNAANHPTAFHHIALMPDCHAGYGLPVGGVAAFKNAVSPYAVGVDIACGMLALKTKFFCEEFTPEKLEQILKKIKKTIPMGFSHQSSSRWEKEAKKLLDQYYYNMCKQKSIKPTANIINLKSVTEELGTLGGGNHFIEIQRDEEGSVWIMIHSGSRHIGYKTAEYHHRIAKKFCEKEKIKLPSKELAFLKFNSTQGQHYFTDMNFCRLFSYKNRLCMLEDILQIFSETLKNGYSDSEIRHIIKNQYGLINIHHNFAAVEHHFGNELIVHRKGATSAQKNELGIIPGSMGTTSYIIKGKGNPESFMSCSHGAGRLMSRKNAKKNIDINTFKQKMEGIVCFDIDKSHLDESPDAYKNIEEVISLQKDLIEIVYVLTPLANCKG